MKATLMLLALVALAAPIFASRELKQIGVDFGICSALVRRNCCQGFDFGNITQLHSDKAWPENTECEFTIEATVPVGIRPLDKPLKKKEDIHEYVDIDVEKTSVNLVATISWYLHKYSPPYNVWTDQEGEFCVCPSPGAAPAPAEAEAASATAEAETTTTDEAVVPPEVTPPEDLPTEDGPTEDGPTEDAGPVVTPP